MSADDALRSSADDHSGQAEHDDVTPALSRRKYRDVLINVYMQSIIGVVMLVSCEIGALYSREHSPAALWAGELRGASRVRGIAAFSLVTLVPITALISRIVHEMYKTGTEVKIITGSFGGETLISISAIRSWLFTITFVFCQIFDYKLVFLADGASTFVANMNSAVFANSTAIHGAKFTQISVPALLNGSSHAELAIISLYFAHWAAIVLMNGVGQILVCAIWRFTPNRIDFDAFLGRKCEQTVQKDDSEPLIDSQDSDYDNKLIVDSTEATHTKDDPHKINYLIGKLAEEIGKRSSLWGPFFFHASRVSLDFWEDDYNVYLNFLLQMFGSGIIMCPAEYYLEMKIFSVTWSVFMWYVYRRYQKFHEKTNGKELLICVRPPWLWRASTLALVALMAVLFPVRALAYPRLLLRYPYFYFLTYAISKKLLPRFQYLQLEEVPTYTQDKDLYVHVI